jgi:hypothetical protein
MALSRTAVAARLIATCVAVGPALVVSAQSATAGTLPPSVAPVSHSRVTPMSGSGTVNDPWVPSKSATIVCQSATIWGNYDGTRHSTPLGTVYYGDTVSVRYETSDHNSVMAYSARANTWGFILRSCVQFA